MWKDMFPRWFGKFQAGQLFSAPGEWFAAFEEQGCTVPKKLRQWIREGYSLKVHHQALGRQPGRNRLSLEEVQFAKDQLREWEGMGAVEEVAAPRDKNVRMCNVVVAYRNGRMDRVCWSGGPINEGVKVDTFRMETLERVCQVMRQGDYAFALDFKKGYMQVPLKESFREYTYMRLEDKVYRWKVLMFGLAAAPKDFSFIVKKVLGLLRKDGVRNCFFIDDIIHFAASQEEAEALRGRVLKLLYRLGFFVSWNKSLLQPGQLIKHLGLDVCTVDRSIWVPEDKAAEVRRLAQEMLSASGQGMPAKTVARFVGKLMSMRLAIPLVLVCTKGLASCLEQLPTREVVSTDKVHVFQLRDYSGTVRLSTLAKEELRLWADCIWNVRSNAVKDVVQVCSFVDACPEGAGAVVLERQWEAKGASWRVAELRAGAWQDKVDVHSTTFELLNIVNVVQEFGNAWQGRLVHLLTDNVGAAHIAGRGCSRNATLHAMSVWIWKECMRWDVNMVFQYLAGDGIIASGADGLSRDRDHADCCLHHRVFAQLWARQPMEVDLFCAPEAVQKHPGTGEELKAVSPYHIPGKVGVDGLSFMALGVLYAFPPSSVLLPLLGRIKRLGLKAVVIGPVWPCEQWWTFVAALPQEKRMNIGRVKDCVVPGRSGCSHPFGSSFDHQSAAHVQMEAWFFNL
jgi:hypothetical protein